MWAFIVQMVLSRRPSTPPPINVNVDLSALRDLFKNKGFIDGEEARPPSPLPVAVMNGAMPYVSGN
jgi:hypothetical protein